jgi:t-SNARE complex subunit (syntaxin)
MTDHVQIENSKLVRDLHSKAILNTDRIGLEDYMMKRELAKKQLAEKEETKQRLVKLENDMTEIKNLLHEIAQMRKA